MMVSYRSIALSAFLLLITIHFSRKVIRARKVQQIRHQQGCAKPPHYQHKDPILGIDLFIATIRTITNGTSFKFFHNLFSKYGKTFEANSWGTKALYTMDSDNIRAILVTSKENFVVEPARLPATEAFLGRGIFNSDGPSWEQGRAITKPIFARAQISNLDFLEARVDVLIKMIPRDQTTVDLLPDLKRLFLDTSTEFLFGQSTDTLEKGKSSFDADKFLASVDRALQGVGMRVALGRFAFLQSLDRSWRRACDEVHAFIDAHIERAIKDSAMNKQSPRYILLDELVKLTQDGRYLRAQLLNNFLPARDSTAIAIANVFFHLARYPRVWRQLREEVLSYNGPLTFELLKHMKYTKSVINESKPIHPPPHTSTTPPNPPLPSPGLRLLAPSGRNIRICNSDSILPSGGGPSGTQPILVEQGTEVQFIFKSMHIDHRIWGFDAEDFRPERWEKLTPIQQKAYIPFSAGPRICPAQQMVLNECAYILVRFVREFKEIVNRDEEEMFVEWHKLQMESRNGVKVAFVV
ncbi:cytochrome P450 protein [Rutstroemia sp. NJR-2017a BBW]|nr:cytochrome P450 protein [Rutstroemia sp. NJR-2017a BBW]